MGRLHSVSLVILAFLIGSLPCFARIKTGPKIGSRIPSFEAADLDGRVRTFDNLKGPNGLVLLFVRSADW